ncbi:MAG: hypothetical protein ACYDAI_02545 [Trichloromonadaceae bacterium]
MNIDPLRALQLLQSAQLTPTSFRNLLWQMQGQAALQQARRVAAAEQPPAGGSLLDDLLADLGGED